ncbi:MAG: hypothetical protein ACK5C3_09010 [bacterium]
MWRFGILRRRRGGQSRSFSLKAVRIYVERWDRETDCGVVAVVDGVDAGACWMRVLPHGTGLASVDAVTPQLGIALEPDYQHVH